MSFYRRAGWNNKQITYNIPHIRHSINQMEDTRLGLRISTGEYMREKLARPTRGENRVPE